MLLALLLIGFFGWGIAADNSSKSVLKMEDTKKPAKKQSKTLSDWLGKLKARINRSKAKYNKIVAVASVRGAKAEDPTPLYWKGKQGQAKIDIEELKKFEAAVDLANSGKIDEAKTSLQAFISSNPKSPLVSDAKETLALLPAAPETAAPPEPIKP